jgi:hypothetical protein
MTAVWLIGIFAALREPLAFLDGAPSSPPTAWLEVKEQTACEAMLDEYCLGRYGFTIKHDGTFVAGPSAHGSQAQGRVKPQELRVLGELIDQLSPSLSSWEENCHSGGLPGIKDQVDITFTGGPVARVYDLGSSIGKICYIGNWDDIDRLHQFLRKLMTRYYPVPFPKH